MTRAHAFAKINLSLVVGPVRSDGMHEVATVLQRIDLHDDLELEPAASLLVEGFSEDTLVSAALGAIAQASGMHPGWRVRIEKRIPVAAGLGGGSSDAASALLLANSLLDTPLAPQELHRIAAGIGADVPFFLREGTQLAGADGTELVPIELPGDYSVLLVLPAAQSKESTRAVYAAFDARDGARGFGERRAALLESLSGSERVQDLAHLPRNDLSSSPLASEMEALGAFRADVSGAGPAVYGLFERAQDAHEAAGALRGTRWTWVGKPVETVRRPPGVAR